MFDIHRTVEIEVVKLMDKLNVEISNTAKLISDAGERPHRETWEGLVRALTRQLCYPRNNTRGPATAGPSLLRGESLIRA